MQLYTQFSLFCNYKIVTFLQLTIVNLSLPHCLLYVLTKLSLQICHFMYLQIIILMKQSNFPYQIVIFLQLPNCHFFRQQIVITKLSLICSYQFAITKLSLPNCRYQVVTIPSWYYQIVISKLSPYQVDISHYQVVTLPSWYFPIGITKLSPYQVGITKLSPYQVGISKLSFPNCHYQIVLTKLTFPKISPSKKEALLPLINIQLDKYNKKIILAREQVPSGI